MIKKVSCLLLAFLIFVGAYGAPGLWAASASLPADGSGYIILRVNSQYMNVNGATVEVDPGRGTAPVVINGRTMAPARAIVEAMGGSVGWDDAKRQVTLYANGNYVMMTLDQTFYTVNDTVKIMDTDPIEMNGRTLIPLRFASEALGCTVEWFGATEEILIVFAGGGGAQKPAESGQTAGVPPLDAQGAPVSFSVEDNQKLQDLLYAADPAAGMYNFEYTSDIDDDMFFAGLMSIRYDESDFDVSLPDSLDYLDENSLYRTSNANMQAAVFGVFGRPIKAPEKQERYYNGYYYFDHWDITHYDSPEHTITMVYDLTGGFYKITGTAGTYEYGPDDTLYDVHAFTALVKKDAAAKFGYYLFAVRHEK